MAVVPATKAVRFKQLWDGSKVIADAVVIVKGDRVVRVGAGPDAIPRGIETIDLRRYTAIPGLIDLHTHITYYWDRQPGTRPLGQRRRPAVTVFLAQDNARRTLETGVTTVRDLGASGETDFAMRDLIAMGAMIGPRMFVAGQGISAARAGAAPDPAAMRETAEERIKAGVGLGQGLRLARQLRQRRHDADDDLRRDEGDRRRRARAGSERSRFTPTAPPASRTPSAPAPTRSSTASISTTRRSRRW